jgi:Icc-related predicted phosphoesterase
VRRFVKILAFTDFHGSQMAFQRARQATKNENSDLVIVAGDIANHDVEGAMRFLSDLAESGRSVYFVPGNMDGVELIGWSGSGNVHALHGRCEYWGDVALVGLGGSPRGAFTTPIEFSEEVAAKVLERALKNYHGGDLILVSHCPPRDTKVDRVFTGQHIGSISVREFVEITQPRLVLSGHVHEAQGEDRIGSSVVVNTGPAKSGNYATVNLDESITVTFARLK